MIFSQFSILREISLDSFQEVLRSPYRYPFVCTYEAHYNSSVAKQFVILVENLLVKIKLGLGLFCKCCNDFKVIPHSGRQLVMDFNADYREHYVLLFHILDRDAEFLHHPVTSAFKKTDIV